MGQLKDILREGFADTFYIWWEEIKNVFKDMGVLIFFIIVPLFYPLIYSFLYSNETVHNVPAAVVDNSHSSLSREFLRKVDATADIAIISHCSDMEEAELLMKETKVYGIILIPEDYEIEEIPAGKLLSFKDGELEAKIDIKQQGRLITTVYDFNVNNSFILAADYAELQKFWTELLDINSLKIVLKKKA